MSYLRAAPFARKGLWLGAALCLASHAPAWAFEAALPGNAEMTLRQTEGLGSYAMPTGPWQPDGLPVRVIEGALELTAWRIPAAGLGTLGLLAPLRDQLEAEGWVAGFSCETADCGGFDFRYAMKVLPEPAMHVDLGDFRFLSATRGDETVALLVSRAETAGTGHLQAIRIGPPQANPQATAVATKSGTEIAPPSPTPLAAALEAGAVVLEGLAFASGKADLAEVPDNRLSELARYLADHPGRSVALVGHTDTAGSAEANMALSKARAEAVRTRLVATLGANPDQVAAFGAGFMAPRDTNLTEQGRARNRRVEVVLTSTR